MTIQDAARLVDGTIVSCLEGAGRELERACGSDMMSDVMAFFHGQGLLLTGLVTSQTIKTANLMDILAVCLVRGKKATAEMISLAGEFSITLIESPHGMFDACGILYSHGLSSK